MLRQYELIGKKEFKYKLSLDDLPSAMLVHDGRQGTEYELYDETIPIVELMATNETKVFNHLHFRVETNNRRIVGFEVEALSVRWKPD